MNLRIVYNAQTERYRVEQKGLLGWTFVTDPATGDYLTFDGLAAAETWVREHAPREADPHRRWKVVSVCQS